MREQQPEPALADWQESPTRVERLGALGRRLDAFVTRLAIVPGSFGLILLVALVPILVYATVDLDLVDHVGLSLLLVGMALAILRFAPPLRIAATILSVAASTRYIWWRSTETLYLAEMPDAVLSVALLLAELYAYVVLIGGYLDTAIQKDRDPVPLDPDEEPPSVDVLIPTYDEPVEVLRRTIVGATSMTYPNYRVYVLDDGSETLDVPADHRLDPLRERLAPPEEQPGDGRIRIVRRGRRAVEELARQYGAEYRWRPNNKHYKAGNLNAALGLGDLGPEDRAFPPTTGELVAIFDADHVPVRSFLDTTVGFFQENPNLALVQTPHHFYNPDPFERNLGTSRYVPPEQALFYHSVQKGNDFWNAAFFCGSCAVLRRTALARPEVDGIAPETVTEDAHTALKLHSLGFDSAYLDIPQAAGLAPERFNAYLVQRMRWARGMVQILRLDNPLFRKGLTLAQRLNYFNAAAHFLFGVPRLVYLVAPAAYLIFGLHPLQAEVREVLVYMLPHLLLAMACNSRTNRNIRHSFWPEVYETAIAPYTAIVTTLALLAPRKGRFNVTTKGVRVDRRTFDGRAAWPLLVLLGTALVALVLTWTRLEQLPAERDTILLCGAWNVYNLLILMASVGVALERRQVRRTTRVPARGWVWVREGTYWDEQDQPPSYVEGELLDLAETGVRMRLHGVSDIPEQLVVTIGNRSGLHATLEAQPRYVRREGDDLVVGAEFVQVSERMRQEFPAMRDQVIRMMFTEPDTWLHDRYPRDGTVRSFLTVVTSPFRALFNRSVPEAPPEATEPLTEEVALIQCPACHRAYTRPHATCPGCGEPIPRDPALEAELARWSERTWRPGPTKAIVPALFILLSFSLAAGWRPLRDPLSVSLPATRLAQPTTGERLGQLLAAHEEARRLYWQLRAAALPGGPPLPVDWRIRHSEAQLRYRVYPEPGVDAPLSRAATSLHLAFLSLDSAREEFERGAPRREVQRRLDSVAGSLERAARELEAVPEE